MTHIKICSRARSAALLLELADDLADLRRDDSRPSNRRARYEPRDQRAPCCKQDARACARCTAAHLARRDRARVGSRRRAKCRDLARLVPRGCDAPARRVAGSPRGSDRRPASPNARMRRSDARNAVDHAADDTLDRRPGSGRIARWASVSSREASWVQRAPIPARAASTGRTPSDGHRSRPRRRPPTANLSQVAATDASSRARRRPHWTTCVRSAKIDPRDHHEPHPRDRSFEPFPSGRSRPFAASGIVLPLRRRRLHAGFLPRS